VKKQQRAYRKNVESGAPSGKNNKLTGNSEHPEIYRLPERIIEFDIE
jgi:hypothetical protein